MFAGTTRARATCRPAPVEDQRGAHAPGQLGDGQGHAWAGGGLDRGEQVGPLKPLIAPPRQLPAPEPPAMATGPALLGATPQVWT
jgi:hypothetical protein